MYLIRGWLMTKEGRIGLPRLKINLDSLEEEPSSYMEQINTWIRFLRWYQILHLALILELSWMLVAE